MSLPRIYRSPLPDIALTDRDLLSYVFDSPSEIDPETPTFVDARSGETRSRSSVISRTKRLLHGFRQLGVREGSVVAFWSPNTIDYAAICFGIIALGATVATFAPALTQEEFKVQFETTEAKFLIVHSSLIKTARLETRKLSLSWIMQSDEFDSDGTVTVESLMASSPEANIVQIPPEDVESHTAIISFTSGIVGSAKAVTISHKNMTSNVAQWNAAQGSCREDKGVWIAFVGFSGVHGLMAFIFTPLRTGLTIVVMAGFDWSLYLKSVQKYRPTQLHVGPPVIYAMTLDPEIENYDLSSVRRILTGGAPIGLEAMNAVQDVFKKHWNTSVCCHQLLGMTETSPAAAFTALDRPAYKPGVGYIIPNMEFRFVDPFTMKDAEIGQGEVTQPAEMWCRGPNVTKAYLQSGANQDGFQNDESGRRWFRTGDMGTIDREGWIELKDRTKDVIRYNGISILPSELESRLQDHSDVVRSCVVTKWDVKTDQEILIAFVAVRPDLGDSTREATREAISDWFNTQVIPHEKLRGDVCIVDSITQTMIGKLLRRLMRDRVKDMV